jgi:hypothetical protein
MEAFAGEYASAFPTVDVQLSSAANPLAAVDAIERGEADVGVSFADAVYFAHNRSDQPSDPAKRLRAISALNVAPLILIVRAHSAVRTVADLRGRAVRLSGGSRNDPRFGSGVQFPLGATGGATTDVTALSHLVLAAYGVDPASVRDKAPLPQSAALAQLRDGQLEAMFTTIYDSAEAVASVVQDGARMIPLEGPPVDRLRREYAFVRPVAIPAGTYPRQTTTFRTVGVDLVLICRRDLTDQVVHDVTKVFFAALPRLSATQPSLRLVDLEQAPATPIPLHDGAARYYRERELLR